MTVSSKTVIKGYFETGDKPSQSNFTDFIDSYQDYAKLVALQDTGAVNAYIITPSPAIPSYALGNAFLVRITDTNTGGSTLNVNGLGAVAITYSDGSTLSANVLMADALALVAYDGSKFQLINVSPSTGGSGISQLTGDVTATGSGVVTATIASAAVTYSKFQNVSANSILCNPTSAAAQVQEVYVSASTLVGRGSTGNLGQIALGSGLTMTGQTLSASGSSSAQIHQSVFTASGTFTTSANITTSTVFVFTIDGAGGGGGGFQNTSPFAGGGGGAGGRAIYVVTGLSPSTGYSITIGAGGTAGGIAGSESDGGAGGNTSITINAVTVTANGGSGGKSSTNNSLGGLGGSSTNGTINLTGADGFPAIRVASFNFGGNGASSPNGGGGRGASGTATPAAAQPGGAPGAGGGGGAYDGATPRLPAAGKLGQIIAEWLE